MENQTPQGWFILQADKRYVLEPGEENNHVIVFEPGQNQPVENSQPQQSEETFSFNLKFEWESGQEDLDIKVYTKNDNLETATKFADRVYFSSYDKIEIEFKDGKINSCKFSKKHPNSVSYTEWKKDE